MFVFNLKEEHEKETFLPRYNARETLMKLKATFSQECVHYGTRFSFMHAYTTVHFLGHLSRQGASLALNVSPLQDTVPKRVQHDPIPTTRSTEKVQHQKRTKLPNCIEARHQKGSTLPNTNNKARYQKSTHYPKIRNKNVHLRRCQGFPFEFQALHGHPFSNHRRRWRSHQLDLMCSKPSCYSGLQSIFYTNAPCMSDQQITHQNLQLL